MSKLQNIEPEMLQEILNAAGSLALAAKRVINSNAKELSFRIQMLEVELMTYDTLVLSSTESTNDEEDEFIYL